MAGEPIKATLVEELAQFVERSSYKELSTTACSQLKICILDSLGCAIGALTAEPLLAIRKYITEFGGAELCTLIGGARTAPDRVAFYNGALVRYLDFNDSFLAPGETCHPSDNFAAVLAATEYAGGQGRDLLVALAVAYQVQCRLSEAAPVRDKGFDHTTQGAYAVAAGVSRALGLNWSETANAIAIAGTAFNALRVTRTGTLSHWKGLAYPNTAWGATHAAFLARRGITGPLQVFEGNKGFMEAIAGRFQIDWRHETLDLPARIILKKYNAEIHAQAVIETVLELKREYSFGGSDVDRVEVDTFGVAYHIIGGGEEGDKTLVQTKEQADHSLQYMVAAAILDGQLMPEQYLPERIVRQDVQNLLRRVMVRSVPEYTRRFPAEVVCQVVVHLRNGQTISRQQHDYEGFHTRPMSWETVVQKFERLSRPFTTAKLRNQIQEAVATLETIPVSSLTGLLAQVQANPGRVRGTEKFYESANSHE